jgi:hypothetical protein
VAARERRRRDLFNKKRSRKELSRRLLSIDFSLVGGQEERREEEDSDEDDDIYSGNKDDLDMSSSERVCLYVLRSSKRD